MISIIVPVYNVEKYLSKCLDSLIGQTYREIEIICINDGSTDSSGEILAEYARKDSRLKIVTQANKGLSEARNCGIDHIKGEWTMFVDSDDWIEKDCCEKAMEKAEYDIYIFSYIREYSNASLKKYIFDKEEIIFSFNKIEWLYKRLISPNDEELAHPDKIDSLSTAWSKLYKSSIIKENNIKFISTNEIGTEDLLFNVYYFSYIRNAIYLPKPIYHYRKNNYTSLTKLYKPRLAEQWNSLFSRIENWAEKNDKEYLKKPLSNRRALSLIGLGLNICYSNMNINSKFDEINNIISSEKYRAAIKTLPLKYFPFHWKIFFFAAKHRCTTAVAIMLLIIKRIITR